MKKRSTVILIASVVIVAAIVTAISVGTHLRLSAVEGNEKNDNETPQEIANEVLTGKPSQPAENNQTTEQSESTLSYHSLTTIDGSPSQGSPTAAITLVEFGDFQCEFCSRFAKDTEPQIYQSYIQNGKVNMVFKHLVRYGSTSDLAATASKCANDQEKFWDYYRILYANQDSFMMAQDTKAALKNLVSKIDGLDIQKFDSCFDGDTYKDIANKDTQLADSLGLNDTPTFLIVRSDDGSVLQKLVGAYPFGTFKTVLDQQIAEVGSGGK